VHKLLPSRWKRTFSKLVHIDVLLHQDFIYLATEFPAPNSFSSANTERSKVIPAGWEKRLAYCNALSRLWASECVSAHLADWLYNHKLVQDLRSRPSDATVLTFTR